MNCPNCGNECRAEARFCDACGGRLATAPTPAREAERRQLTVVFCDLMGSTQLSGQLDPEELREIMGMYQAAASEAIRSLGGRVAMFLGDGILTYFGYPEAQEDDVERAVRASLEIVRSIKRLNESADAEGRPSLAVRVAAHTGDVVVGEIEAAGAGIFGETPNVAARLQGLAAPNGVVISEATYRLVRGLFRVEDLGSHRLEGVDGPMRVLSVLAPSGVASRFRSVGTRTPLVGREREMDALWSAWRDASGRGGRAVLITGSPGLGKSRVVQAFHERLSGALHTWLECAGTPYTRDSAFAPMIDLQSAALGYTPEMSDEDRFRILHAAVERAELSLPDTLPFLARLHSLDIPPDSGFAGAIHLGLSPDAIRRHTMEAAGSWLLHLGRQQPVILLVEDLHWVDPSSLELLGRVLEGITDTRVLLVLTARPGFEVPWTHERMTALELGRLTDQDASRVVRSVDSSGTLSAAQVETIVSRTDGVPLFIEEMSKAAVEVAGDAEPEGGLGVPATLKGLLMARIDRLGQAKQVAQLGATIGREFGEDLIREVWDGDRSDLERGLGRIQDADLVDRAVSGASITYTFKHALIQDAAYEALLKATRGRYHRRIGEALEASFPSVAETRPELLAHHFTQAGDHAKAIPYWATAGQRAAGRSANVEANRHLRAGLECVAALPEGPERSAQELIFRTRLGATLITIRGYGSEEVRENLARAQELCGELSESPLVFPVLYNLWVFHLMRSDPKTVQLADQVMDMAERMDPETLLMWGHVAKAITHYWQADFEKAVEHARACREHYRSDPSHVTLFGDDPGAYGYVYEGLALWFMGHPDRSTDMMEAAVSKAREMQYAFTVAGSLAFLSQQSHFSRDVARTADVARKTVAMSQEQHFPVFLGSSLAHHGWTRMREGQLAEGHAEIGQGIGLYRMTGAVLNTHYFLALQAEAHLMRGERAAGLDAADEGLSIAATHLDRIFVPELHRLRGELLLLPTPEPEAAAAAFDEALAAARQSGARMLELRAACSLARLRIAAGRGEEARQLLGPLLDTFDEGEATADVQDAFDILGRLDR